MLSALATAFQSLSRIPIRSLRHAPDSATLAASSYFYPLVGCVIGLSGFALYWLLRGLLPRDIVFLGVLALWILLTGALHEDGLADTFDAFGSQSQREEIFRVLKDSAIGTYGALALIVASLIRWRALAAIEPDEVLAACVLSQILPRTGIVPLAFWAGPATAGTGGSFAQGLRLRHVLGTVLVAAVLALPFAFRPPIYWAAGACSGILIIAARFFHRRLGGVTGDCLGAVVQLQELAVLLALRIT